MTRPRLLRAPRENGAIVAEPPLEEAGSLLDHNQRLFCNFKPGTGEACLAFLDRSWDELRRQARNEILTAARDYLIEAGEPPLASDNDSLLMAGHQPDLFHPGVWAKSFALNGLARRHGLTPVNLIIDNDTVKSTSLHVPTRQGRLVTVPYDQWSGDIPYEDRLVRDEALFQRFAKGAAAIVRQWNFSPMLADFWAEVNRQAYRTPLLGERFAAARRDFERRWGCHNLEVPVSRLCQTEAFTCFTCALLADLPRFHAIYNASVREYRKRYGIRSRNHPVPDLAVEGDWHEAPFWVWQAGNGQRHRLFVRAAADRLQLKGLTPQTRLFPIGELTLPAHYFAAFQTLERQGHKLRSRALTTTLYVRLFLADLFVHGIGGGKYDEVTDNIIRRYYGTDPPRYLVLSATLLLPFPPFPATPQERSRLQQAIRDRLYNPQRHMPGNVDRELREAIQQKNGLLAQEPADRAGRHARWLALRKLNSQLLPAVAAQVEQLRSQLARCEDELRANAVLHRRDYAFCLYPETELRPFCERFLEA